MAVKLGDIVTYHLLSPDAGERTGCTPHDPIKVPDAAVRKFIPGRVCPMIVSAVYPNGTTIDGHVFLANDPLPLLVQGCLPGVLPGEWA